MLLSGKERVSEGDSITVRVLYEESESVRVDRPLRNKPLKIHFSNTSPGLMFDEVGTYELSGTVKKMTYADKRGLDHLFFCSDVQVNHIADSLVRIEVPDESEEISPHDHTDTEINLDVESLSAVELTETQSTEK